MEDAFPMVQFHASQVDDSGCNVLNTIKKVEK